MTGPWKFPDVFFGITLPRNWES